MENLTRKQEFHNSISDFYSDENRVYEELHKMREKICCASTKISEFQVIEKLLSLMYLNCPASCRNIVHAILIETELRKSFFAVKYWGNNEI